MVVDRVPPPDRVPRFTFLADALPAATSISRILRMLLTTARYLSRPFSFRAFVKLPEELGPEAYEEAGIPEAYAEHRGLEVFEMMAELQPRLPRTDHRHRAGGGQLRTSHDCRGVHGRAGQRGVDHRDSLDEWCGG